MPGVNIDIAKNPDPHLRIDSFSVPDAAREEFEAAMRRNMDFIKTVPGFLGHVAFEKAGEQVRAYYRRIGFAMPAMLARWGVKAELGNFSAPRRMQ